mmetsp:Transcript_3499/g.2961  ORF Transcript_3499/g.2961 Transcript_3499/m.2961 type:complete len:152 (+) Transcript_3499:173-628(+)
MDLDEKRPGFERILKKGININSVFLYISDITQDKTYFDIGKLPKSIPKLSQLKTKHIRNVKKLSLNIHLLQMFMEDYSLNCKFTVEDLTLRAVNKEGEYKFNRKPNYALAYNLLQYASNSITFDNIFFADGESPSRVLLYCLHVKSVSFKI